MTKQHQYHNDRDHAGNDQVLAEAPATWPRAHGIADDWLLGEGLLWIQVGFVPIGRELVAAELQQSRRVGKKWQSIGTGTAAPDFFQAPLPDPE